MHTWIGIIFFVVALVVIVFRVLGNRNSYKKNTSLVFWVGLIACLIGFIGWAFFDWRF